MFDQIDTPFALVTERYLLRRPRMADAMALARLAHDRTIAENTAAVPYPYGVADAEAFIALAGKPGNVLSLLALDKHDGTLIGCGGLKTDPAEGVPEIGYWIGGPFRGNGAATEIVRALIDYAFGNGPGADRISARCRVTNGASRRVLEKCGFQWIGAGLERCGLNGSAPVDRFRLDRGVWASLRAWGASSATVIGADDVLPVA